MKIKLPGIFFAILISSPLGFSQASPCRTGMEIGLSVSDWSRPLPGPVLGLRSEVTFFKHLQLSTGIQYQLTGNRYYRFREEERNSSQPAEYIYTSEEKRIRTFHKLAIPVTVGYTFKMFHSQMTIFSGYRANLFLGGTDYEMHRSSVSNDPSRNYYTETRFNPFSKKQALFPANRFYSQLHFRCFCHCWQTLEGHTVQ